MKNTESPFEREALLAGSGFRVDDRIDPAVDECVSASAANLDLPTTQPRDVPRQNAIAGAATMPAGRAPKSFRMEVSARDPLLGDRSQFPATRRTSPEPNSEPLESFQVS